MKKRKKDLITELQTAEHLLLEKHEELTICQDELARLMAEQNQVQEPAIPFDEELLDLKSELENIQEVASTLQHENNKIKDRLNQALSKLEKLTSENEALTKKLEIANNNLDVTRQELAAKEEDLKVTNKKLAASQKELEVANKKIRATHDELCTKNQQIDTLTAELDSSRKNTNQLAKELETALATIEAHTKAKQSIPTSSHSFRLDIYPRNEDTFQSRIEHLLSGERQALTGLDVGTITDFISHYLPEKESQFVDSALTGTHDSRKAKLEKEEKKPSNVDNSTLIAEALMSVRTTPAGSVFTKYNPFQLHIQVQTDSELDRELSAVNCKISVYARNLNTGKTSLLGIIDEPIDSFEEQSLFSMNAIGLPQGFYRIDTVALFTTMNNEPLPITIVNEGAFIQVT